MATKAISFSERLSFGKIGESLIANWFKRKGYAVLPVYEKEIGTGKGPQVYLAETQLVAPDMLCFKGRKVFWIEAKHKSVFSWHRRTQSWVTGIDLHHYEDYLRVARCSPWDIWLLFLHENDWTEEPPHNCPVGLFGGELDYLSQHENHRHANWGRSGMVYWTHETLHLVALLSEVKHAISTQSSKSSGSSSTA